jgi:hypothetical protein
MGKDAMTSRERITMAASFQEPDRVPIELQFGKWVRNIPEARRLQEFVDREADNFLSAPLVSWGFMGLDSEYREEIIRDVPGEYRWMRRTHHTEAGEFHAITRHSYEHLDSNDFHWERRFIHDLDDMRRLAAAPRRPRPFDAEQHLRTVREHIGDRSPDCAALLHPLGTLVRNATMEEVYGWLLTDADVMRRFLESSTEQIVATIAQVGRAGVVPWFMTFAHEMLIPPWLGMQQFKEWVYTFDKPVNDAIHAIGGKHRSHCHGNCMEFLEVMAEMGVDSIEPLEPPPFGNVNLAEAKRRLHGRMLLSGNVMSNLFNRLTDPAETRDMVKRAIDDAAAGGGFTLRTTGGHAGLADNLTAEQQRNVILNIEAYVDTGLEYGKY